MGFVPFKTMHTKKEGDCSGGLRAAIIQKISWGNMPPPPSPLETYAFGARLGNRSVFILDPRLLDITKPRYRECMSSGEGTFS